MLNEKDIKSLAGAPRMHQVAVWVFILGIALFLFGAIYNLYLAFHYAGLEGLGIRDALSMWNEETVLEKLYSGYNLESKHRLNMSILHFGCLILFSCYLWFIQWNKNRNSRILSELVSCGALTKEQLNV